MHQTRFPLPVIVVALALAQAVCWGTTFNIAAITGIAVDEALDVPYFVVMMGPTVMLVVMALIAVPLLQVFKRGGMRLVMTASAGLGAIGLAIVASAMSPGAYFVGWLIVGAAGGGMLTTAVQIAMAELAGASARKAIGVLMVFGGLGTTLCWPLLGAMQAAYGWRAATLLGAAALLIVAAPIYWLLLAERSEATTTTVNDETDTQFDWSAFGLLAFSTAANGIVTRGFPLTIITLFESRGLNHGTAILIASFVGVRLYLHDWSILSPATAEQFGHRTHGRSRPAGQLCHSHIRHW